MHRSTPGVIEPAPPAPLPYPIDVIEAALGPLVLPARWERLTAVAQARIASVVLVLEALIDPHNAAAILRTADALGVGELHLVDLGLHPLISPRVTKGCEHWMDLRRQRDSAACAAELHARGFEIFVADAQGDRSLEEVAQRPRVALVFGNEHLGVTDDLRRTAKGTFAIPMRGMVESFNVSVAAGIALYVVTRGRAGDAGEAAARGLRARFLMESVREPRMVIERYLREHGAEG